MGKGNGRGISGFAVNRGAVNRGAVNRGAVNRGFTVFRNFILPTPLRFFFFLLNLDLFTGEQICGSGYEAHAVEGTDIYDCIPAPPAPLKQALVC